MSTNIKDQAKRIDRFKGVLSSAAALKLDARIDTEYDDELADLEKSLDALLVELERQCHMTQRMGARYRTLYESSQDAIMTLAPPTWDFSSGNAAAIELFGAKDEAEFTSKGPGDVSPEFQADGQATTEKVKRMIMQAMETGTSFFEWTHQKLTGETFPATVLLTRMEQDGEPVLQATVRDISQRKEAEEALRAALDEAERLNRLTMGREKRVVEVKREVNALLTEAGQPVRYESVVPEGVE